MISALRTSAGSDWSASPGCDVVLPPVVDDGDGFLVIVSVDAEVDGLLVTGDGDLEVDGGWSVIMAVDDDRWLEVDDVSSVAVGFRG